MRIKYSVYLLVFTLFFSCDKTDDKSTDSNEESMLKDDKKPELIVNGFTNIVETFTEITIKVTDDSSVETKIMNKDQELYSSSEKELKYSLNPYTIPVGETEIVVLSTDVNGNKSSKTYSLEIKHLLMSYNYGLEEDERNPKKWIFFNDLDGKPLANLRSEIGSKKVYTDELINSNEVYYSIANYKFTENSTFSNKNLLLTTNKIPLGKSRESIVYGPSSPIDFPNILELKINLLSQDDGYAKYWSKGLNYTPYSTGGGGNLAIVSAKHDGTAPLYFRTPELNANGFFDGKKENYTYKVFQPQEGFITLELNEEDFEPADSNLVLDIPTHDSGTMNLRRYGYEDNEALLNNIYHDIYQTYESENTVTEYYDLPVLEGLGVYRNQLFYKKNGVGYFTQNFDEQINANMPNWTLTSDINETSMGIIAQNPEVDYYLIKFKMNDTSDFNNVTYTTWNYRIFGENDEEKVAPRLTVPVSILNEINVDFYRNLEGLQFDRIDAYDYDEFNGFKEVTDWFALIKSKLNMDKNTFRKVTFYN